MWSKEMQVFFTYIQEATMFLNTIEDLVEVKGGFADER